MTRIASHSTELSTVGTDAPEWVQLFPYGTFSGRDGRGPYTLRDQAHAQDVLQATEAYQRGADVPIDYDHQLLFAQKNGLPAIAGGWIKSFEARPDGLYGRVEWTAAASSRVAAREYRYLSPVFRHRPDGTVTRLMAAALTNMPNLELTALASSALFSDDIDEDDMDVKQFAVALGLPETTTADQLTAHCQGLKARADAVTDKAKALAPAVGKADTDKPEDIVAAASAAFTGLATALKVKEPTFEKIAAAAQAPAKAEPPAPAPTSGTPDPAEWVPMGAFKDLQEQVAAMSQEIAGGKASEAVEKAMAEGKISPSMKGWAESYAQKDLDGFVAYASQAPVIVAPTKPDAASPTPTAAPPASNTHGLDDEQVAVCSQMSLDPAEYAKTLKETA